LKEGSRTGIDGEAPPWGETALKGRRSWIVNNPGASDLPPFVKVDGPRFG